MFRLRSCAVLLAVACLALGLGFPAGWLVAQEAAESDPSPSPPAAPRAVLEEAPPLHVLDKEGKLVPVPGVTLERLQELLREEAAGDESRPRFHLEEVTVKGLALADRGSLEVSATVVVNAEQWIRVPLRLEEVAILTAPKLEGDGDGFLGFEESGGYIWWVRGKSGSRHKVRFTAAAPITEAAHEQRLKLSLPRSVQSQLTLEVPEREATARVTGTAILEMPRPLAGGFGTEFTLRKLAGTTELFWSESSPRSGTMSVELEAVGAIAVSIDGQQVRSRAQLNVQGFRSPLSEFVVRLPRGARLVEQEDVGYSLTLLGPSGVENDCLVKLNKPATGPVEVRIATDQPSPVGNESEPIELGRFEVRGALRQRGHIAIQIAGDWQPQWQSADPGLWRTDELPETLPREQGVIGFEYVRQPFILSVRLTRRSTRTTVEPEYIVYVGGKRLRLEARLKYAIRGAKAFSLAIDLAEWELTGIETPGLVDQDALQNALAVEPGEALVLPLLRPLSGIAELAITLERAIPEGASTIEFGLPRPMADSVRPAALVVLADDDVSLQPDAEKTRDLARQPISPPLGLRPRQQAPWYYRAESPQARFAAEFSIRPRKVAVRVESVLRRQEGRFVVEQTFRYQVDHTPLSTLTFQFPAMGEANLLEIQLDELRLQGRLRAVAGAPPESDRQWQFDLPQPRIGAFIVTARQTVAAPPVEPEGKITLEVPLVVPREAELFEQSLRLAPESDLSLQSAASPWSSLIDDNSSSSAARETSGRYSAPGETSLAHLTMAPRNDSATPRALLQRVYLQTWLTRQGRIDHVAFRVHPRESTFGLRLPPDAQRPVLAAVDGAKLESVEMSDDRSVILKLSPGDQPRVVEFQYRVLEAAEPLAWQGRRCVPPRPLQDSWTQRLYWEVLLPADEQIILPPSDLVQDFHWSWSGIGWEPRPNRASLDLERWVGISARGTDTGQARRFVFTTSDGIPDLEFTTMRREVLVLIASLAALAAGLLVVYLPRTRRTGVFFLALLLLVLVGLAWPAPAILTTQSALLGIGLAIVAAVLERQTGGRIRRLPPRSPPHAQRRSSKSSAVLISTGSTATAQAAPEEAR